MKQIPEEWFLGYLTENVGRESVVGIASRNGLDGPEIESRRGRGEIFRTPPNRPWGPSNLLYNGYRDSFPWANSLSRGVDHPTHLVPRLNKEKS